MCVRLATVGGLMRVANRRAGIYHFILTRGGRRRPLPCACGTPGCCGGPPPPSPCFNFMCTRRSPPARIDLVELGAKKSGLVDLSLRIECASKKENEDRHASVSIGRATSHTHDVAARALGTWTERNGSLLREPMMGMMPTTTSRAKRRREGGEGEALFVFACWY